MGDTPSGRSGHAMATSTDGTAVVFGGNGGDSDLDDLHTLDVSGGTAIWIELASSGDIPRVEYDHTMVALADGTAVMFGGSAGWAEYSKHSFTLELSGISATWTELNSAAGVPSARFSHAITTQPDGSVVVFRWQCPQRLCQRRLHIGGVWHQCDLD